MQSDDIALRMLGISKRYGSVTALQGADFTLKRGEVMALLGENGAGKSTLVKILAGLERADAGTIEIAGEPVRLRSPTQSLHAGVAYVTQELSIVGPLSVAENICLGGTDQRVIWTGRRLDQRVRPFLELVGLDKLELARSGRQPLGCPATVGRGSATTVAQRAHPDPGRADGRAVGRGNRKGEGGRPQVGR